MNKKIPSVLAIGIILILAIIIGGAVWMGGKNIKQPKQVQKQETKKEVSNNNQTANKTDETANWQTYRNEKYGFEVKYPNNFITKESRINLVEGVSFWDRDFLINRDISMDKLVIFDVYINCLDDKCIGGHYSGPGVKTYKFLNLENEKIGENTFIKKNFQDIAPYPDKEFKFSSWEIKNKDIKYTLIYNNNITVNPEPHLDLFEKNPFHFQIYKLII